MISNDWANAFMCDVIASPGGYVGVFFSADLSILGGVGLGELSVVVLEEQKYCPWSSLKERSWKRVKRCL